METGNYIGENIEDVIEHCCENNTPHYIRQVDGKPTGVIVTMGMDFRRLAFDVQNGLVCNVLRG